MPHLNIDNFKLYYEDHGQGHPLLLIAGLNCDSRVWTLVLDELKQHFRVIFFDNRGVGQSQGGVDLPFTIEKMAEDAFRLLNHLQIKQISVIGHSMGGTIAQTMAYLQPHRIQKLVICNSLVKVSVTNKLLGSALLLFRSLGFNSEKLMRKALPLLFAKQFRKNKELVEKITHNFLEKRQHPQAFISYKRQLEALLSFNSGTWLDQIYSPTLVIAGHEDLLCPRDSKVLARSILRSELVSLPNVGHVPMLEQPQIFTKILTNFLN